MSSKKVQIIMLSLIALLIFYIMVQVVIVVFKLPVKGEGSNLLNNPPGVVFWNK